MKTIHVLSYLMGSQTILNTHDSIISDTCRRMNLIKCQRMMLGWSFEMTQY